MSPRSGDRQRVLLVSQDVVGEAMAGPGIRYAHLARVLAGHVDAVLAVPDESSPAAPPSGDPAPGTAGQGFAVARYTRHNWASIEPLVDQASIVVCPSDIVSDFPPLAESPAFLVVDGYDPLLAEWLALSRTVDMATQGAHWRQRMCELNQQVLAGDFFLCASERQRDWWLGLLEANGRINPWTFGQDPTLRQLIAVVPYGMPEAPPRQTRPALKGVWPGIGEGDRVLLWGGGLWPWLDPLTAVRAVARLRPAHPDLRLVFPGAVHPNPWLEGMPNALAATRRAAEEMGLLDTAVFFTDWFPYADWPNVLLESDVALALGLDTLEARLAFRSRVLEYIWAGVPIVATRGDACSDLVGSYRLGEVVDYQDVDWAAAAIARLLATPRPALARGFEQVRADFTWERAAQPLIEFCLQPRRAPDKEALGRDLGAPFYLQAQQRLEAANRQLQAERDALAEDRDNWRDLVHRYEQGRFIRLMKRVETWRQRLRVHE